MNKQKLKHLIHQVPELIETAEVCLEVGLPNFYIAGGAITQIIWNSIESKPLLAQVKDFDVVYFDSSNHANEDEFKNRICSRLSHGVVDVDVKNQAIIHERYSKKFGCSIQAYERVEQGIESWLSAFAIGFTLDSSGNIKLFSPYGLEDAFNMLIKPNKKAMTEANYNTMTAGYKARWHNVQVLPWS
ncbi:nucleotidyltransferase family protein [Vibrio sp. 03-59-1]|uniref:nucleotidyltransferase family protein n=1 Tax=Vibrio sp. 03-59-1 TaxID=2607607 RepID=UPI0014937C79|nr:nucleotidyltransferase family protein [Vibrio sp. 03-59-1]NOH85975.1 nucleotidyltransferase family protein [Vibrio sp. 03-59-1]